MTVTETTARGQTAALSFDVDLPHPPDKVWRALTEPALLARWLLPAVGFEPVEGAAFTLQAPPQPGWDGLVHGRMLDVDAPRRLSWAWVVGDLDTVVTFTLTPTGAGTRLSIVHAGFRPDQPQNLGGARYGWRMMTGRLVELLGSAP